MVEYTESATSIPFPRLFSSSGGGVSRTSSYTRPRLHNARAHTVVADWRLTLGLPVFPEGYHSLAEIPIGCDTCTLMSVDVAHTKFPELHNTMCHTEGTASACARGGGDNSGEGSHRSKRTSLKHHARGHVPGKMRPRWRRVRAQLARARRRHMHRCHNGRILRRLAVPDPPPSPGKPALKAEQDKFRAWRDMLHRRSLHALPALAEKETERYARFVPVAIEA